MVVNITNMEAKRLMEENAKIIDIRDKEEFNRAHIAGSINININDLKLVKRMYGRNQRIIVVCAKGIRSVAVAEELSNMGYNYVYNLMDGYDSYKLI